MTASIETTSPSIPVARRWATGDRFLGFGALARKDLAAWRHGIRPWVILIVSTGFMTLAAANAALNAFIAAQLPADVVPPEPLPMDPVSNLAMAVGAQIFVFVAIFASIGVLTGERERGTLSWVASKPVSRTAIWLSSWSIASLVVTIVGALVPLAATVAVVVVLYGIVPPVVVAGVAVAMAATIVLFMAVGLAASTVTTNQAAVAAIGFAVMFVPQLLGGLLPIDITPFLPTSIFHWTMLLVGGQEAGFVTPIAWAVGVVALAWAAIARMDRLEL
jgi:ABC-type transport system involved in multi-copper enzyme maturation permease subunit